MPESFTFRCGLRSQESWDLRRDRLRTESSMTFFFVWLDILNLWLLRGKFFKVFFLELISKYGLCQSELKTWKLLGFEFHRQWLNYSAWRISCSVSILSRGDVWVLLLGVGHFGVLNKVIFSLSEGTVCGSGYQPVGCDSFGGLISDILYTKYLYYYSLQ